MKQVLFFNHVFPPQSSKVVRTAWKLVWCAQPHGSALSGCLPIVVKCYIGSCIHAVVFLVSVIGLAISGAVFATSWETSALRTAGGGLIRIGMPRQEVLKELGQPERSRRKTPAGGKSGKKGGSLTYRGDDGLYTITFSDGRVARIVVTPNRD